MSILVTGVAGFIGYHVAKALIRRGEHILGIDNLNDYYDVKIKQDRLAELTDLSSPEAFRFAKVDIGRKQDLDASLDTVRIDRIVHLAAQAGVRHSIMHPELYVHSNLVGHANILELARTLSCRHLVYASSSSVYGGSDRLPFRVEDRADHPVSLYAATKRSNELMSETYAHLYRLPMTGLRFFTVYGPWGRPDMAVWEFTRRILAGEPIPLFNGGRMRRDFTFISDIVAGVLASLDAPPPDDGSSKLGGSDSPHRIYNLGNSRSEEVTRMVSLLELACGRSARIELHPMQAGDVPETYADISATSSDLGYAPTTSLDAGLPKFVDWYRDYATRRA